MAEMTVLVCYVCQSGRDVEVLAVQYAGSKYRTDLCGKCFKEMSRKYGLSSRGVGWAKTQVVEFDQIPRNTP